MEKTLATTIKTARKQAGLLKIELANLVGISLQHLNLIEKGKIKKPNLSTLRNLSKHLNLDIDSLKKMAGYSCTISIPANSTRSVELGLMIKKARLTKNLSIKELAELSGITPGPISHIEHGDINQPRISTLVALAAVLNLDLELLKEKAGYIMPKTDTLAGTVQAARYQANLSIKELADICKISANQILNIEQGKCPHPRPATVKALSKALSLDLESLKKLAEYVEP